MPSRLPTCAVFALILFVGAGARAAPEAVPGERAGFSAENHDGPRAGWNWRAKGDLTAGAPAGAGASPANAQSADGSPNEIYTVGGKPLSPSVVIAPPEPTGPLAALQGVTPKGAPTLWTWALILIGFGLIAVAVRGLLRAHGRLTRLMSHDDDAHLLVSHGAPAGKRHVDGGQDQQHKRRAGRQAGNDRDRQRLL